MVATKARKRYKIGTQIPSFKPLSTLSPSRILAGTNLLLTTALPSAASVGANNVAIIATSNKLRSSNIRRPTPKPSRMVKGSPINNKR